MQTKYMGILVLVLIAAGLSLVLIALSYLLGPKKRSPYKDAPYECGVAPIGDARERFPIKFYVVAIVFILFDIEAVFLWSFYTVFKGSDQEFMVFAFWEFLAYMATWILGYAYAIKVKAIDWDDSATLAPEKLEAPKPVGISIPVVESPVSALGGVE